MLLITKCLKREKNRNNGDLSQKFDIEQILKIHTKKNLTNPFFSIFFNYFKFLLIFIK